MARVILCLRPPTDADRLKLMARVADPLFACATDLVFVATEADKPAFNCLAALRFSTVSEAEHFCRGLRIATEDHDRWQVQILLEDISSIVMRDIFP